MNSLERYRQEINVIDDGLIKLVGERLNICRDVARHKSANNVAMMQPGRVEEVKERCAERGLTYGLDSSFTKSLYDLIIAEACRIEDEIIGEGPVS